jgi:hypothetical protein
MVGHLNRSTVRAADLLTLDLHTENLADLVRSRSMSEQAELYKNKAAECERQAKLVSAEHLRKVYLELARPIRSISIARGTYVSAPLALTGGGCCRISKVA